MTNEAIKPDSPPASGPEILAANRLAIAQVLGAAINRPPQRADAPGASSASASTQHCTDSTVARFFSIAQGVWANHPARAALNLAVPVVERSIRRRPVASVAIAAGFGASVVLIPEWRRLLFATGRKAMLGPISTAALASVALNLFTAHSTEPRDI